MEKLELFNHSDYQKQIHYLAFKILNSNKQVFAVTSVNSKEGKTTTVYHTAHALKLLHRKVCVVQTDMQKKGEANIDDNLVSLLESKSNLYEAVKRNEVFEVDSINAGYSEVSTSLIASKQFDALLVSLKEKYDVVLFDCGALAQSVDSLMVSKKADALILVVGSNEVSKNVLEENVQNLRRNDVNIFGAVLNKASLSKGFFVSKEG